MLIPKNSKDVKGLREFLTTMKSQMCSAAGAFSEPLKAIFTELGTKFDAVVNALPADDKIGDWDLECQLGNLFSLMSMASSAASQAALENSKLKDTQAELAQQYASQVTSAVQAKITAGELVTKDAHVAALAKANEGFVPSATVTQLCSESLTKGIAQGEQRVRGEITAAETIRNLITTRKTSLQTASIALPDTAFESILGGTDEEFTKVKAMFESRLTALKADGIQLASDSPLLANLWLPEKEYGVFLKTVAGIPALKIVADPLASSGSRAATGKSRPLVV